MRLITILIMMQMSNEQDILVLIEWVNNVTVNNTFCHGYYLNLAIVDSRGTLSDMCPMNIGVVARSNRTHSNGMDGHWKISSFPFA